MLVLKLGFTLLFRITFFSPKRAIMAPSHLQSNSKLAKGTHTKQRILLLFPLLLFSPFLQSLNYNFIFSLFSSPVPLTHPISTNVFFLLPYQKRKRKNSLKNSHPFYGRALCKWKWQHFCLNQIPYSLSPLAWILHSGHGINVYLFRRPTYFSV